MPSSTISSQHSRHSQRSQHSEHAHQAAHLGVTPPFVPTKTAILKATLRSRTLDLHDSVARDHLANERTFLAWIRTGFATSALGIVIARLQVQGTSGVSDSDPLSFKILSIAFIIIGILCLSAGSYRYAHVEVNMEQGFYPTSGAVVALVAILGLLAFGATLIILLV